MKKLCSWLNGTQKQQGPAEKTQQQEWHGHTDIGVHLRSPRRPQLGTEVQVPRRWEADLVLIHSANNILYLLGTRPSEAVRQVSKATMTSGSHARACTHVSTRVSCIFILVGHGESGSAIRSCSENRNLQCDSYIVEEGAAIPITSLGHALSSFTALAAQLPWLLTLAPFSSRTFLLLPFLFIYL